MKGRSPIGPGNREISNAMGRLGIRRFARTRATSVMAAASTIAAASAGAIALSASASPALASTAHKSSSSLASQVAALMKSPTTINQTVPLKSAPPKKKEIDFIGGTAPQVTTLFEGVQAAGKALGWTVRRIPGYNESDPASYVSALNTALQHKPVAVVETAGVPESEWKQVLPAYKAAHITIVPAFGSGTQSSVVTTAIPSTQDEANEGIAIAKWVAYNASGKAKNVMLWDIPAFSSEPPFVSGFKNTLPKYCSGCKITMATSTLGEFTGGTVASDVISQLRRSHYDYFVSAWGEGTDGVSAGLATAGITGLTVASNSCDTINENAILAGKETLCSAYPYKLAGWIVVDTVLRKLEGMKVPVGDGGFPAVHLLTKANRSSWTIGDSLDQPDNYPAQFKKLWHLS